MSPRWVQHRGLLKTAIGDEGPEEAEWGGTWDGSELLCALGDRDKRKYSGERSREEMTLEMVHCPPRVGFRAF